MLTKNDDRISSNANEKVITQCNNNNKNNLPAAKDNAPHDESYY